MSKGEKKKKNKKQNKTKNKPLPDASRPQGGVGGLFVTQLVSTG